MVTKPNFKDFFKNGYFIHKIKNKKDLVLLKKSLLINSKKILKRSINDKNFFDNFHNLSINNNNDFRMNLMKKINNKNYGSKIGYRIFSDIIEKIFGKDVVTQKNINLVIQRPGDDSQTTVHRDSPPNSLYEIVVWVPLTKTYKTKNMYILDKKQTSKIYKMVNNSVKKNKNFDQTMEKYFKFAFKNAKSFNLNFGEAIIFWAPLVHCVETNKETTTRWSFNCRFKGLFTPYGDKKLGEFFQPLSIKPATKVGMKYKLPNI